MRDEGMVMSKRSAHVQMCACVCVRVHVCVREGGRERESSASSNARIAVCKQELCMFRAKEDATKDLIDALWEENVSLMHGESNHSESQLKGRMFVPCV